MNSKIEEESKIYELRKQYGFSYKELANRSGLSVGTIFNAEKGKKRPTSDTLYKLAVVFDCQITDLTSTTGITNKLKKQRMLAGLSIVELARASGINHCTIGVIENGTRRVRQSTLKKIADALGCDISDIQ